MGEIRAVIMSCGEKRAYTHTRILPHCGIKVVAVEDRGKDKNCQFWQANQIHHVSD